MKKLIYLLAIVATLSLASCSSKSAEEVAENEATELVDELNANIDNPEALATTITKAVQKIEELEASDPEAAKAYKWKLQEYYEKNKENLTVAGAISALGNLGTVAGEVKDAAKADLNTAAEDGKEAAKTAVENNEKVQETKAKAEEVKQDVETAKKAADDVKSGIEALKSLKK